MAVRKPIRRALVSVYEKSRLLELGKALQDAGVEILSTGSTAKTLAGAGIAVTEVSEYTGFPEIMGGRVKTLHPRIHSGILADQNNPEHLAAIADLDIAPFDLVVINLYPFAATIASGADLQNVLNRLILVVHPCCEEQPRIMVQLRLYVMKANMTKQLQRLSQVVLPMKNVSA